MTNSGNQSVPPALSPSLSPSVARVAVLVVDDELGMRETLVDILEAAGYDVASAPDGVAALEELKERPYAVCVMDVRMPRLDGVEVLRMIGRPPPHVILMTAYAVDTKLRDAVDEGAFAVVHKPFSAVHLLTLVARAAERAA